MNLEDLDKLADSEPAPPIYDVRPSSNYHSWNQLYVWKQKLMKHLNLVKLSKLSFFIRMQ